MHADPVVRLNHAALLGLSLFERAYAAAPAAVFGHPTDLPAVTICKQPFSSAVHPRLPCQVTLIGSDGLQYIFLAKPKDDLRKASLLLFWLRAQWAAVVVESPVGWCCG
jgi:hypothetical protein